MNIFIVLVTGYESDRVRWQTEWQFASQLLKSDLCWNLTHGVTQTLLAQERNVIVYRHRAVIHCPSFVCFHFFK
jgi:hypothetical protein